MAADILKALAAPVFRVNTCGTRMWLGYLILWVVCLYLYGSGCPASRDACDL